jgi:hypothetical protein
MDLSSERALYRTRLSFLNVSCVPDIPNAQARLFVPLQLPLSPMGVFPIGIERTLAVTI